MSMGLLNRPLPPCARDAAGSMPAPNGDSHLGPTRFKPHLAGADTVAVEAALCLKRRARAVAGLPAHPAVEIVRHQVGLAAIAEVVIAVAEPRVAGVGAEPRCAGTRRVGPLAAVGGTADTIETFIRDALLIRPARLARLFPFDTGRANTVVHTRAAFG